MIHEPHESDDKLSEVVSMLQIVRRSADSAPGHKPMVKPSVKEGRLEFAFVALASTNIFVIASAVAFYFLAYAS